MKKILAIFFITLLSCQNQEPNDSAKLKFLKTWYDTEQIIPFRATLKINPDNTFEYNSGACQSRSFSAGFWKIKNDSIILNTKKIDSCYYAQEYGIGCQTREELLNAVRRVTQKNCVPNFSEDYYEIFENEIFYIKNDTLIHKIDPKDKCPEHGIKFSITPKK